MRRIFIAILCLLLLTTAVSAAGSVTDLQSNATLASDGTCKISMVLQISMDGTESNLKFPLPGAARDITLNGDRAKTSRADSLRWVDLSGEVHGAGNYTLTLQYSLPDLVRTEENGLVLALPLLSGFSYPINSMAFTVTLPGQIEGTPKFTSTYYPESMGSYLDYTAEGSVISGHILQGLKDHETLTMTLSVTEAMFPQNIAKQWSLSYDDLLQYGLLILALIYWLIFLRCGFFRQQRRVQAPDGVTAGELGCCLSGLGVDFPMMVLSWAQMGYLTIELGRNGRVLLHKTMDMGNERSEFEVRTFKTLFGKRSRVDGSGEHFARLGRKAGKTIPGFRHYFKKSTGNPLIFRGIVTGIGAVAGYSLAVAFASDTLWQVLLSILLVPLGTVLSWLIQEGARGIRLRHRLDLFVALGCCGLWLLLGSWSNHWAVAIFVIFSQVLAGLAAIHGGRRTESGVQVRCETAGLHRYLRTITTPELIRNSENNPDYYFTMVPNAMALGVDGAFARKFGNRKLPACPYLQIDGEQELTARQWNDRLRHVVRILDDRQRKLIWEKLFKRR